jgi:predicted nucleotidyltransferase
MLVAAAAPIRIILFGSSARGNAGPDSDIDLLVVEKTVRKRRMEMVRLREVLRPLNVPVDIIVISERTYSEWWDTPGTVIYEAAREGKIIYEAS